jgi:hypothetical protein
MAMRISSLTIAGALTLATVACQRRPELVPASGAAHARGMKDAVQAVQSSVRVIAQVRDWPGPAEIADVVTPLRIVIDNGSPQALQIRYDDFEIRAPNGATYRAVPPAHTRGVVVDTDAPVTPKFRYNGFYAAPYYRDYYQGVPLYGGSFAHDAPYYDAHFPYWQAKAVLPTAEMLARALPEGVLNPGGKLDGYLYFEKVHEKDGAAVDLRVRLRPAGRVDPLVAVSMPFVVR